MIHDALVFWLATLAIVLALTFACGDIVSHPYRDLENGCRVYEGDTRVCCPTTDEGIR